MYTKLKARKLSWTIAKKDKHTLWKKTNLVRDMNEMFLQCSCYNELTFHIVRPFFCFHSIVNFN